jgi:hypothetical protein
MELMGLGYIYILTNPSIKRMVKIGRTMRPPEERAAELSKHTGLPTAFSVAYHERVSDCDLVENLVHEKLNAFRVSEDREFFKMPLKEAIQIVAEICKNFIIHNKQPETLDIDYKPNVFIVDQKYKADYKVYFVDEPQQERNVVLIAGGKLVRYEHQANVKVYIVNQEYQADIKITKNNFPT